MIRSFRLPFLLFALGATFAVVAAEPQVFRLEPKKMAGIEHGKAIVVKGDASSEPHRFLLDGLSSSMPIVVWLRPVHRGDEVALRLTKYAWNQPLREASTNGKPVSFKFRTEGEFQISVSAKQDKAPYRMLVWVGEEVKPDFTPVVVKASEYKGGKSGGGSLLLWVIAGTLIAAVVLLAVMVLRRRKS